VIWGSTALVSAVTKPKRKATPAIGSRAYDRGRKEETRRQLGMGKGRPWPYQVARAARTNFSGPAEVGHFRRARCACNRACAALSPRRARVCCPGAVRGYFAPRSAEWLKGTLGKRVYRKPYRWFESHSLRQLHLTKHSLPARQRAKNFNKHRY
jgi:hypothetical protein